MKPRCLLRISDPESRAATARWLRAIRANGDKVYLPPPCTIRWCPRHGDQEPPPGDRALGFRFRIYESIGYSVVTRAARDKMVRMSP